MDEHALINQDQKMRTKSGEAIPRSAHKSFFCGAWELDWNVDVLYRQGQRVEPGLRWFKPGQRCTNVKLGQPLLNSSLFHRFWQSFVIIGSCNHLMRIISTYVGSTKKLKSDLVQMTIIQTGR